MSSISFLGSGRSRERRRSRRAPPPRPRRAAPMSSLRAARGSRADLGRRSRRRAAPPRPPPPARSAKTPNAVGPEPVIRAPRAPASRSALEHLRQLGPQRQRRRLEVVLQRGGQLRPAGRPASSRSGRGSGAGGAAGPQPVQLGVDVGGARGPRSWGTSTSAIGGSSTGSTRSPVPVTIAWPGSSWLGTSLPSARGDAPRSAASSSGGQRVGRAQHRRGVGAAAAQAGRHRDPLVDRHPQRRRLAARPRGTRPAPAPRGSRPPRPGRPPRRARPPRSSARRPGRARRTASDSGCRPSAPRRARPAAPG